jgi:hypothetical protein
MANLFNYFDPKLVRFRDGTYGVMLRKFLTSDEYIDFRDSSYAWTTAEFINKYCKSTKEHAVKALEAHINLHIKDKGTICD